MEIRLESISRQLAKTAVEAYFDKSDAFDRFLPASDRAAKAVYNELMIGVRNKWSPTAIGDRASRVALVAYLRQIKHPLPTNMDRNRLFQIATRETQKFLAKTIKRMKKQYIHLR